MYVLGNLLIKTENTYFKYAQAHSLAGFKIGVIWT